MIWMLSKHIHLPEDFNLKLPKPVAKRKTKVKEFKKTESESEDEQYSEPYSEGDDYSED